jgi:hypothetical protein
VKETSSNPVFRFTSVLTARKGSIRYFQSPDEVPRDLQRDIDRALQGDLTANIILADEGGQKYLQSRSESKPPVASRPGWRRLLVHRLLLEGAGALALVLALWVLAAER